MGDEGRRRRKKKGGKADGEEVGEEKRAVTGREERVRGGKRDGLCLKEEEGIRDSTETGVKTCANPIFCMSNHYMYKDLVLDMGLEDSNCKMEHKFLSLYIWTIQIIRN